MTKTRIVEVPYLVDSEYVVRERFEALDLGKGWIRHGKAWEFNCEGRLVSEGIYQNGVREGWWRDYHPDGSLDGEGAYANDEEEGVWRSYHPNGRLAAEGMYVGGSADGLWRYWTEDGKEEESILWKEGCEIDE